MRASADQLGAFEAPAPVAESVQAYRLRARYRAGWDRGNVMLTPAGVLEPVRAAMGGIELDPCTEPDNPTRADRWYALPIDGLAQPWDAASIWVNPPYGEARWPWVRRCLELGQARRARIGLLIHAATDTELVQAVLRGADACTFVAGRLRFGFDRPRSADGAMREWRSTQPSLLACWGFEVGPELGARLHV